MLELEGLACVSVFTSLDVWEIREGTRHGAEAEGIIATSILEGLSC